MRFIPKFIRQMAATAIFAELEKVNAATVDAFKAKARLAILKALRLE